MLQQADEAAWERARIETRPATRDVYARGIGLRRLQLIECPSFEQPSAWEVRQREGDWWLFRSSVVDAGPDVQLVGYGPVPFDPEGLTSFFNRLAALCLPLAPDLSGYGGADGTLYQLALFGDLWSEWRLQWWSEHPPQWQPLVDIAAEMLAAFKVAAN